MARHRWLALLVAAGTAATILSGPAPAAVASTLAWTPEAGTKMETQQPDMFAALRRDLNLSRDEAIVRIGRSKTAHRIHDKLRSALGRAYGGAWLDKDGAVLTVAVADKRLAETVRAAGAVPRVVAHPLAGLQRAVDRMHTAGPPPGIRAWYVDQAANTIVVETTREGRKAGAAMVARAKVNPALVRYVTVKNKGTITGTAMNVYAGDKETKSGCTVGFGVRPILATSQSGFLTAGHCGPVGQSVRFGSLFGRFAGNVAASTYTNRGDGPDQGWSRVTSPDFRVTSMMHTFFNGTFRTITETVFLVRGDFVCQAGRVSKFRCGTVDATGLKLPVEMEIDGEKVIRDVTGLTQTNACAANGDSGGPWAGEGFQAAGVGVGAISFLGVASCGLFPDGPSYYQPIDPILFAYGLELIPPPPSPPPAALRIDSADCGREETGPGWVCYARWSGGVDPTSASWRVLFPRPQPYVVTDVEWRMTEAHFACDFNQPEPDYSTTLTVQDAVGARASWFGYVCSW